jgi:hypothetical protein
MSVVQEPMQRADAPPAAAPYLGERTGLTIAEGTRPSSSRAARLAHSVADRPRIQPPTDRARADRARRPRASTARADNPAAVTGALARSLARSLLPFSPTPPSSHPLATHATRPPPRRAAASLATTRASDYATGIDEYNVEVRNLERRLAELKEEQRNRIMAELVGIHGSRVLVLRNRLQVVPGQSLMQSLVDCSTALFSLIDDFHDAKALQDARARVLSEAHVLLITEHKATIKDLREQVVARDRVIHTFSPADISALCAMQAQLDKALAHMDEQYKQYTQLQEAVAAGGELATEALQSKEARDILQSITCPICCNNKDDVGSLVLMRAGCCNQVLCTGCYIKAAASKPKCAFCTRSHKRARDPLDDVPIDLTANDESIEDDDDDDQETTAEDYASEELETSEEAAPAAEAPAAEDEDESQDAESADPVPPPQPSPSY